MDLTAWSKISWPSVKKNVFCAKPRSFMRSFIKSIYCWWASMIRICPISGIVLSNSISERSIGLTSIRMFGDCSFSSSNCSWKKLWLFLLPLLPPLSLLFGPLLSTRAYWLALELLFDLLMLFLCFMSKLRATGRRAGLCSISSSSSKMGERRSRLYISASSLLDDLFFPKFTLNL